MSRGGEVAIFATMTNYTLLSLFNVRSFSRSGLMCALLDPRRLRMVGRDGQLRLPLLFFRQC